MSVEYCLIRGHSFKTKYFDQYFICTTRQMSGLMLSYKGTYFYEGRYIYFYRHGMEQNFIFLYFNKNLYLITSPLNLKLIFPHNINILMYTILNETPM